MRVANKLTPETKNKTTKPGHGLGKKIKSRPSSSLFQKVRGSGATLKTLKSPHRVVYAAQIGVRQALNRSRNNVQSCSHGKVESKTKYSASQITLITWTTHPRNKQGIQAEKTSTKNLHSKKGITILLQKPEYRGRLHSSIIIRSRNINIEIIYDLPG